MSATVSGREAGIVARVETVLAGLDLRQRIGQVNQRLFGWDCVRRVGPARAPRYELTDALLDEIERWDGLGALYGLFRADAWSGRTWATGIRPEDAPGVADQVIAAVRDASPAGIAPLLVEEAPHGHQSLGGTVFPTNLGLAASWDPALVAECAAAVATELRAGGIHVALVSALDLARDPRWGRSEECFGENPRLASAFAAAVVTGMQGTDRSRVADGTGVAVVLKHLAGQGEGLGGRNGHSAVIGPHDLAELHLPPVRAGIAAGALGVMGAYNDIDGIPCCANPELLTGWLRGELGFDGIVMADGQAVDRLVALTGSEPAAAALAMRSGVDLSLWDRSFTRLAEAVDADPGLAATLETACRRVLLLKARLGLLDGMGHPRPPRDDRATVVLSSRAAAASLVVLDDDAERGLASVATALAAGGRLVVTGAHADLVTSLLGDYVPPLPSGTGGSVLDGLRARSGAPVEHHAVLEDVPDGLGADDVVVAVIGGTSHRSFDSDFADNGALQRATAAELPAELRPSAGEGVDRTDLALPGDQTTRLAAMAARTDARVIAVVVTGRAHVLTGVVEAADATVVAWYPGPFGGDAIAAAVLGEVTPIGRLPVTLPRHPGVVPIHDDDRMADQARYSDVDRPVLAGLGAAWVVDPVTRRTPTVRLLPDADVVLVEVEVHNPHDRVVEDVVALFGHRRGGARWPRDAELLAFTRVRLAREETLTVTWQLAADTVFAAADATTWLWVPPSGGPTTRPVDDSAVVMISRGRG